VAYWTQGILPKVGTVCPSDMPLYSNVTWADVLAHTSNNTTNIVRENLYDVSPST
jgi:hypothetical protein